MKYIVITSKHHDGFAMFHSKASPYNIVRRHAVPARSAGGTGRGAASKQGIRLGFYYSQAQDWHHPGGARSATAADIGTRPRTATSTEYYPQRSPFRRSAKSSRNYGRRVRALVGHAHRHDPRARREAAAALEAAAAASSPTTAWAAATRATPKTPEQYIPATGYPRPRLGNLHDHERHLGLQVVRHTTGNPPRRCSAT